MNSRFLFRFATLFLLLSSILQAGPTSEFWTYCTTQVQPYGTMKFNFTNYFSLFNRRGHGESFPTDVALSYGLFEWNNLQAEFGIDYLGPSDDPLYFNAKMGVQEDKFADWFPGVSVGIFNVGTRTHGAWRTNQNVVDIVLGHSLPDPVGGNLYVGGYSGSRALGKDKQGFMVAFDRGFVPSKDCHGKEYKKWVITADYASGKNNIGGGGIGLSYYYTPDIYIETGPTFFNDAKYLGSWKWSIQLYYNVTLFDVNKK